MSEGTNQPLPVKNRFQGTVILLTTAITLYFVAAVTGLWTSGFLDSVTSGTLTQLEAQTKQLGFDLNNSIVDRSEILSGGPPKDGIPSLTNPRFSKATDVRYLKPDDRVIGVAIGQDARAYPLAILNYHEIANDKIGETAFAVTYCPLCDSAAVFDRRTSLGVREFGVSGLLHNSNLLMYDRRGKPESLWSQIRAQGISGPAASEKLKLIPFELTTWKQWSTRYPKTLVLSEQTGHKRDYQKHPYVEYFKQERLMFPVKPMDYSRPAKSLVLGVWHGKKSRGYPMSEFSRDRTRIEDEIDGKKLVIEYAPDEKSLRVAEAEDGIQWIYSFWFAWYSAHPDTTVYQHKK